MNEQEVKEKNTDKRPKKKLPKGLRIALKTLLWTVGGFLALIVLAMCLVVWILTPNRLTPIAEEIANDALTNATVTVGKAELTVWSTFPVASIEIDSLEVHSSALAGYDSIPACADSLLFTRKIRAEIDLSKAALMNFDIKEILIDEPKINLVSLNDTTANFLITPPSEPDTTKSTLILPQIILRKFRITNNKGIRYCDLQNNLSATLNSDSIEIGYIDDRRAYRLNIEGDIYADVPDYGIKQSIPYLFKGIIDWNTENPYLCRLNDFRAEVAKIPAVINTTCVLGDTLNIKKLSVDIGPIKYRDIVEQIPQQYLNGIDAIQSDLAVKMATTLDKPYRPAIDNQPSFHATVLIPESYIQPGKSSNYRINKMNLDAQIAYNGDTPDKSTVTLKRLLLDGFGINIAGSGTATNLLKDPMVNGKLSGGINFARLLKLVPKQLPLSLSGKMDMATSFRFALSDLNVKSFQKIQVNGEMDFTDVAYNMPKDSTLAYVSKAKIKFGTDASFTNQENVKKKLLMASFSVDSASAKMPGLELMLTDAAVGAGSAGRAVDLLDTTKITPIGARVKLGKLNLLSTADSVSLRLRNLESNGSIRQGKASKKPDFNFDISADRIRFTDKTTSMNLREGEIKLAASERIRKGNKRTQHRIDSLARLYPDLSRDSIMSKLRSSRKGRSAEAFDEDEIIDLKVDNKLKKLLNTWNFSGSLKAKRGTLFTPYFPLRNILKNVDMNFNLDTFDIRNIAYKVGNSDMTIKGQVRNIRRTLTGGTRNPLAIDFDILSDSLDANQLIATMYQGQAFANDTAAVAAINMAKIDDDNEEQMQKVVVKTVETDTVKREALLVPKNIDIDLKIRNKNAKYAQMDISNLRTDMQISKGVLQIRNLSGKAYDGMLRLDMVYATADKHDIGAGLFLELDDIQVGKFLDLMPGLDSIMPMLKGVDGVINAKLGASTKIDSLMNIITPTTNAALQISGKDLILLDSETFRKIAKMMLFKNKDKNLIDSLSVEVAAYDSRIDVYPFILSMDRYKFGLTGHNDFDMNYNYHVSILKSPLPFKFGVNISGNPDDMKIRLGKAKLKDNEVARSTMITDSSKVNLFRQMRQMFRDGAKAALKNSNMDMYSTRDKQRLRGKRKNIEEDGLDRQDSLNLINEGLIERPDTIAATDKTHTRKEMTGKRRAGGKTDKRIKTEAIKPDDK